MERISRNKYQLSTGREVDANHGLIGIAKNALTSCDSDDDGFEIGEGYDGHVDVNGLYDIATDGQIDQWTPDEKIELAEFLIAQWQAYKAAVTIAALTAQRDALSAIIPNESPDELPA